MHESQFVNGDEAVGDSHKNLEHFFDGERFFFSFMNPSVETLLAELHHRTGRPQTHAIQRCDIWVRKSSGGGTSEPKPERRNRRKAKKKKTKTKRIEKRNWWFWSRNTRISKA